MDVLKEERIGTRQAAKLLGVSQRTVQLWAENGVLDAWKTVGGHRRINMRSIAALMGRQDRLVDPTAAPEAGIMIVSEDTELLELYEQIVSDLGRPVRTTKVTNGFDALINIGKCPPRIVIADLSLMGMDCVQMLWALHRDRATGHVPVLVVTEFTTRQLDGFGGLPEGVKKLDRNAGFGEIVSALSSILDEISYQVAAGDINEKHVSASG